MSWTSVEDSLYTAIKQILPNNTVIIADQNGAEPKSPYAVIQVLQHDQVGREEPSYYIEDTETGCVYKQDIRETFETTVRIFFISKDTTAVDSASNLSAYFYSKLNDPFARYNFARENLSIMRKSSLKRAPVIRDTDRYNSYSIDIVFAYCLKTTEIVDYFDTVTVSGKLTGSVIDPHVIEEFTIPS